MHLVKVIGFSTSHAKQILHLSFSPVPTMWQIQRTSLHSFFNNDIDSLLAKLAPVLNTFPLRYAERRTQASSAGYAVRA
jgi:hypothetical protein